MSTGDCKFPNPCRRGCGQGCFSNPVRARSDNRVAEATLPATPPAGSGHCRGFTIVETLLAISLLGVFSLLAFRLIGANMSITEATLTADSNTARFDRAVRMLRSDVSASASIEMTEPGLLRIHGTGGQPIEWKVTGNSLTRSAASDHRSWDVGQPLKLKLDSSVVLLSISPFDQIAMASLPKGAAR